MPSFQIGTGVYIPNWNCIYKSDGLGRTGVPDGWRIGSSYPTATGEGTFWETLQTGGFLSGTTATDSPSALPNQWGRCIRMHVPTGVNTNRMIQSPPSVPRQFDGANQMGSAGETAGQWYYTLRFLFRAIADSTYTPGTKSISIYVSVLLYNSEDTSSETGQKEFLITTLTAADVNAGWKAVQSTPSTLSSSGWTGAAIPTYARIKIVCADNSGTGAIPIDVLITDVTLETLGPIDVTANVSSGASDAWTLWSSARGAPQSMYDFTREPSWEGRGQHIRSLGTLAYQSNGLARYTDPSRGNKVLRWDFPVTKWRYDDMQRLLMLWYANKGYPSSGTALAGQRLSLVLNPNQGDMLGSYYCTFPDDQFPLSFDGNFAAPGVEGNLYKGTVSLEAV